MTTIVVRSDRATTSRGANIALWVLQALLAALFLMAGGAKLAGPDQVVQQFDIIGMGQWLRYLTGALEVIAAILLVIPGRSGYGALLVACIMVGATAVHLFVLQDSPIAPLVLLALAAVIVWARLVRAPKASVDPVATHS